MAAPDDLLDVLASAGERAVSCPMPHAAVPDALPDVPAPAATKI